MGRSPGLASPHFRAWLPICLVAAVTILTVCDNSATRVYTWPWFPCAQLVLLLPFFYLLTRRVSGPRFKIFNDPLSTGVAVLGLSSFVSAAHSEYRELSIPFSASYLFLAANYFSIVSWSDDEVERPRALTQLARLLGVFITLVIITSFAQWWLTDLEPALQHGVSLKATFRNGHPFGHSNYTAGFAALTFPWLVALAWNGRRFERVCWSALALLAIALIASTGSRGGVVGLLVALTCFGALTFWKAPISRPARTAILLCLTIVAGAMIWHEPRLRNLLINRRWDHLASESNLQRQGMAEAGWLIGRSNPALGIGPGTVPYIYPRFRAQLSGGVENVLQVHNTYLEIWAEMGALAVISMMLLAWGLAQTSASLIRRIKLRGIEEDIVFPAASLIGLVAYAAFAFTDHQLDVVATAMTLSIYLAFQRQPGSTRAATAVISKRAIVIQAGVLIGIGLAVILFTWPNARARRLFSAALDAWYGHDQSRFLQLGHEAAAIAPWDTAYLNEIAGLMLESVAKLPTSAAVSATNEIKTCFQQSLARDPRQEYPHFSLGWIALKEGSPNALAHFHAVAQLVPDKGGVYLGQALALLNQDRTVEVPTFLALEALNDPSFLASAWWELPDFKGLKDATRQSLDGFYSKLQRDCPQLYKSCQYNEQLSDWLLGSPAADPGRATDDPHRREYFTVNRSPQTLLSANSISYKNQRLGFPVLVRHADFPAPHDIYEVQENSLIYRDLKFLFPPKGWLPTFELAAFARTSTNHVGPQK